MRVGQGYDAHRMGEPGSGRSIRLGGVDVPFDREIVAHSDGDVVLHALCDALLGAIGAGDIGEHFPDTDPAYKDVDSLLLLRDTAALVARQGFKPVNVDITLVAQAPRVTPFKAAMSQNIAEVLSIEIARVNIKATTTEGMGFIGRKEGLACLAVVLVE